MAIIVITIVQELLALTVHRARRVVAMLTTVTALPIVQEALAMLLLFILPPPEPTQLPTLKKPPLP